MPSITGGHHIALTATDGLDHFAFCVESRAALEAVIVFRGPDNIQREFWLPSI